MSYITYLETGSPVDGLSDLPELALLLGEFISHVGKNVGKKRRTRRKFWSLEPQDCNPSSIQSVCLKHFSFVFTNEDNLKLVSYLPESGWHETQL